MSNRIEDYALIGNCETVALVGRDGSIDWMCMPRFDSAACFAALLGEPDHGRWLIAPAAADFRVTRRYRGDTMILETTFETAEGAACVIDLLSRRDGASDLVRIVRGMRGSIAMHTMLAVRFDYGAVVPWVSRRDDGRISFTAGPDQLVLDSTVPLANEDQHTSATFTVAAGEEVSFMLTGSASFRPCPPRQLAADVLAGIEAVWLKWPSLRESTEELAEPVRRSLLTLKALTHWETGGIVAAATTSLPEKIGGPRNWDYRYCWLRDAMFSLSAMYGSGYVGEAKAWRDWLIRAMAGRTAAPQIMYGIAGETRLPEYELPWLPGYERSAPVRVGNAAVDQVQLDVYGEVIGGLFLARCEGHANDPDNWEMETVLIERLEKIWDQPDDGIWEVRGGRRHFTHSKAMAWLAFDCAVRSMTEFGLPGPVERWSNIRDAIHRQVCEAGFNAAKNCFVQSYGAEMLDASLLLLPLFGFLPADDPRIVGTVAAIERELVRDGLVLRYDTGEANDGLPPGEGAFLACSFWLVDNYVLQGRMDDARALFKRLLSYRNDVGLLAEEYDPVEKRQLGNFPQAFSHLALINSALLIADAEAEIRGEAPTKRRRRFAQPRRDSANSNTA